jgi:hypothetical protein
MWHLVFVLITTAVLLPAVAIGSVAGGVPALALMVCGVVLAVAALVLGLALYAALFLASDDAIAGRKPHVIARCNDGLRRIGWVFCWAIVTVVAHSAIGDLRPHVSAAELLLGIAFDAAAFLVLPAMLFGGSHALRRSFRNFPESLVVVGSVVAIRSALILAATGSLGAVALGTGSLFTLTRAFAFIVLVIPVLTAWSIAARVSIYRQSERVDVSV